MKMKKYYNFSTFQIYPYFNRFLNMVHEVVDKYINVLTNKIERERYHLAAR